MWPPNTIWHICWLWCWLEVDSPTLALSCGRTWCSWANPRWTSSLASALDSSSGNCYDTWTSRCVASFRVDWATWRISLCQSWRPRNDPRPRRHSWRTYEQSRRLCWRGECSLRPARPGICIWKRDMKSGSWLGRWIRCRSEWRIRLQFPERARQSKLSMCRPIWVLNNIY